MAVQVRKVQVKCDQVWPKLADHLEREMAISGRHAAISVLLQGLHQDIAGSPVIFHDQDEFLAQGSALHYWGDNRIRRRRGQKACHFGA